MQWTQKGMKRFVKEVLGCGCSDEVFATIEYDEVAGIEKHESGYSRVVIGDRLLIYLWHVYSKGDLELLFSAMMNRGTQERDENGLNRFRLVVLTVNVGELQLEIQNLARRITANDQRLHVHVVNDQVASEALQS